MSELTAEEKVETMRRHLVPKGSLPLVGLRLQSACYVQQELIVGALDELEKLPMMVALGHEVSPLQRLAIMLLKDSAWIKD